MFDITTIIEAVFMLLAAIITAIVIPYIKSKTTASQQAEINAWVKIAEQIYTGSGKGEAKKAYVLNWIREHGITVDDEKLDALIEAAVYELTNNGLLAIEQGVIVGEDDGHEAG